MGRASEGREDVPAAVAGLSGLLLLSDTGQNRSPLTTSYLEIRGKGRLFSFKDLNNVKI